MSENGHTLPHVRHQSVGFDPEAVLRSALVEIVRQLLRDELDARVDAIRAAPTSSWMTPPAAARASGVPVKSIRTWVRTGRIRKRLRNSSVDPKQQKYLVNLDDVVAHAERTAVAISSGDIAADRARARAQEILAALQAKER